MNNPLSMHIRYKATVSFLGFLFPRNRVLVGLWALHHYRNYVGAGAMVLITTSQLASILFCFTFLAFLSFYFCLCFRLFGFEHVLLNS